MSIVQYNNRPAPFPWLPAALDQPYWDASDLSTMFQDTAGLVPASAPGQPIALMRDKSRHGINLIQPTVAARPMLSRMPITGRRNLLTYTDLRNSTAWRSNTSPLTVISEIASEGFTKVELIGTSADRRFPIEHAGVTAVKVGETVTFRGMFKPAQGCTTIALGLRNSTAQWAMLAYDIAAKTTSKYDLGALGTGTLISAIEVQSGVWELVVSFNCTAIGMSYAFAHFGTGGALDLRQNSPITSCEIGKLQLEMGSIVTPYQKVTNTYDVTESGVQNVWSLFRDPIDDALNANLPAGTYTRINVSPEQVISFDEGIFINASVNILRQPYTSWTSYINRTLTSAEKSAIIAWWASR